MRLFLSSKRLTGDMRFRMVLEGLAIGLLCSIAAVAGRLISLYLLVSLVRRCELAEGAGWSCRLLYIGANASFSKSLISSIFIAPIFETVIFLTLYLVVRKIPRTSYQLPMFIVLAAITAWLGHGGSIIGANRVAPFMILAYAFFRWARVSSTAGFFTCAWSHIVWNASTLSFLSIMR